MEQKQFNTEQIKGNFDMSEKLNLDDTTVHLAMIIIKVKLYLEMAEEISKNLNIKKLENDFWDVILKALIDLIIIESHKLIDTTKSTCSLYYLMKLMVQQQPTKRIEIDEDKETLKSICESRIYLIRKLRHNQRAHQSASLNQDLPQYPDFREITSLLDVSEEIISRYVFWHKGDKNSIKFDSQYVPHGNKPILEYIRSIINFKN